jgi:hypothetical protein
VLSDAERRVLAELELALAGERARDRRPDRAPGVWRSPVGTVLLALGVVVLVVLSWGAGSAVVALAAAGGPAWSTWRIWPLLTPRTNAARAVAPCRFGVLAVPGGRPWTGA